MDAKSIVQELQDIYPGKSIIQLPETNPSEIICQFDPPADHPEFSIAMAIIDSSAPHYHKHTTEIYHVVRGQLKLYVGEDEFDMYEGQQFTITPGQVHWAKGNATWVEVYSSPGYQQSDHILV